MRNCCAIARHSSLGSLAVRASRPTASTMWCRKCCSTIHRARATYDPRRSFEAWLRIIVERRAIDVLRQMRRHGEREVHAPLAYESYADEAIDHSAGIEHKDKAKRIGAALTELPQRQREAVQHLMVDERSLADAAVLTGRSKGSLKVKLASGAERTAPQDGSRRLRWTIPMIA